MFAFGKVLYSSMNCLLHSAEDCISKEIEKPETTLYKTKKKSGCKKKRFGPNRKSFVKVPEEVKAATTLDRLIDKEQLFQHNWINISYLGKFLRS